MRLVIFINLATLLVNLVEGLGCISDQGVPVNSWTIMKLPNGFRYTYSDTKNEGLLPSLFSLDSNKGALAMTLAQIYKKSANTAYAMYNDQQPDGSKYATFAHAKGIVGMDTSKGFWIIHSMPKFPNIVKDGYAGLPDQTYGQHFYCVTFPTATFDTIASQLMIMRPKVYDNLFPLAFAKYKNLANWLAGVYVHESSIKQLQLQSSNGNVVTHFAKSKYSNTELWEDVVAPGLKNNLYTETWQNGGGDLNKYCPPDWTWTVEDIENLVNDKYEYSTHQDHSKWAISSDSGSYWVCLGDINRQISQAKRGGGTLCYKSKVKHSAFLGLITDYQNCKAYEVLSRSNGTHASTNVSIHEDARTATLNTTGL